MTGTTPSDRALIEVIVTVFLSEARMFAALSATNEAILRADAPEELFKRVCDAAVFGGGFKSAGALLAQGDEWLHIVAAADTDGNAPPRQSPNFG